MSFVAVAIGGSALVGAGASIISGNKASKAQQQSSDQATQLQREQLAQSQKQYEQSRADLTPYREAGYTALGQLAAGTAAGGEFNRNFTMADYTADPGYQFRLDQGNRGVEASAAARGGVLSGGTLKALARFNQGEASQEYNAAYNRYNNDTTSRYNRLAGVAGVGQTATNTGIAAGEQNSAMNAAGTSQIANNMLASGNARASSYVNTGNAIGQAANTVGSYFALKNVGGYGGSTYSGTPPVYGGTLGGIY